MRKFSIFLCAFLPIFGFAATPNIIVFPQQVIQGEPVKIVVEGVTGVAAIRRISFDGKTLGVFLYQGKPVAFLGVDLKQKSGEYEIVAELSDGRTIEKKLTVAKRPKVSAPLGIPEKLGGNTPAAAEAVVSSLVKENQTIYSVRTFPKTLWTETFKVPIPNPVVTDAYGYSRQTIGQTITHKGTDFRADEGTKVSSMNRGIVRFARPLSVYGKTVIVDHGLGIHTLYMHLSKIKVNEGELVKQGQLIGFSGKTGYAESPHLHVSVWIDKVSIDPMKFMALFK